MCGVYPAVCATPFFFLPPRTSATSPPFPNYVVLLPPIDGQRSIRHTRRFAAAPSFFPASLEILSSAERISLSVLEYSTRRHTALAIHHLFPSPPFQLGPFPPCADLPRFFRGDVDYTSALSGRSRRSPRLSSLAPPRR